VDMILITSAYWGAFLLKYEGPLTAASTAWYLNTYPLVLVAQLTVFYALGLYRGAWRVAEVSDLIRIALVVPPAVALSYTIAVLREPPPGTLGFFWIDALVLGTFVAGIRSAYKHLVAYVWPRDDAPTGTALIYGADRSGQLILRELLQNPHIGLQPIGFLDDDLALQGQIVNRMPVLGSGDDLKSVVDDQAVSTLILSAGPVQGYRLRKALSVCQERGITVILQGSVQLVPLRTNGAAQPMYAVQSDSQI
jgi:UDP-GlcNAc:undecaprenyl-phosphate/decaprenyl-phosphate GlcNAc-1-phosphate transferase